jgi:hypothetical protein
VLLAVLLVAGGAQAKAMAGVRLPETIQLQGQDLLLEHMALKKLLFFDVYVWGLYLGESPKSIEEAIASQKPKQLQLHFRRDLNRDQLVEAFRKFLSKSPDLKSAAMRKDSELLVHSLLAVRKGDSLVITYIPDKGLQISGEGSRGAFIPGKDFADALFSAWLDENPIYR